MATEAGGIPEYGLGARSSGHQAEGASEPRLPLVLGSLPHDPRLRSYACDSEGASQVGGRRSDCPPTPIHRWAVPDCNLTRRRHRASRVPPPESCNTASDRVKLATIRSVYHTPGELTPRVIDFATQTTYKNSYSQPTGPRLRGGGYARNF